MWRTATIAIGLSVLAPAAYAQSGGNGSVNPLAVTWDVETPAAARPLMFNLQPEDSAETATLSFRVPLTTTQFAPTAAPNAWDAATPHFDQACDLDEACGEFAAGLGLRVKSDSSGMRLGALVRFGEDISAPRSAGAGSWQLFAAADAHAVTWSFDRTPIDGEDGGVRVEEKKLVGDAQVGVTRKLIGGDLAFGFVHREVSHQGVSRDEQFGGMTFVMSR